MHIPSIIRRGLLVGTGFVLLMGAGGVSPLFTGRAQAVGLTLDKLVTANQSSASATVTSPTFTTSQPGELLVAFLGSDGSSGQTFSGVVNATGGSLTWTLRKRTNAQAGTSEIWTAVAPSVLTNASVRGTHSGNYQASITVATFTGADVSTVGATGGANATTGAPTVSLTTTRAGSWVWGVGNDWDRAVARTVGANQTKVSEYLASNGDTMWAQRQTNVTTTSGTSVTLNDTAPTNDRWNFSAIEILPATATAPDTTAPSVPADLTATAVSPTQVNLSWTASSDDTAVTGYTVVRDSAVLSNAAGVTYSDGTAVAGNGYSYSVRAFDAAGNTSADSTPATVTTPLPDTTAPAISAVTSSSVSQTTVLVTWQTDEAADTQVEYGATAAYGSATALNAALVTSHSQALNGLSADTVYNYRVKSKDVAGNLAISDNATFTTPPIPVDNTAPTVNVTAPADSALVFGAVNVTATAADDTGVNGVQFLLDGVALGAEDTVVPYSVNWNTTTATGGSHVLTAVARDAAGNTTASTPVGVTVNNSDLTAPTAAITAPATGATLTGTTSVTATATDNIGVAGVQFRLDGAAMGGEDTVSPYSVSWNTVTASNGTHQLTVVARDAAGNTTVSATVTVTVNNSTGGGTPLAINGAQTFQTMDGFGVNANSASWKNGELRPAIDTLISGGSTIWRTVIDNTDWEATDDDADPNNFNWTYYNTVYTSPKFEDLWSTMAYLNEKGITDKLILSNMGPGPAWMGGSTLNTAAEDEWVEMMASQVYYARTVRGLQFGLYSPANEADLDCIEGTCIPAAQFARIMGKLAVKLNAIGLTDLKFTIADNAEISKAYSYADIYMNDPVLMAKVDHFAIHNYNGTTAYNGVKFDNYLKSSAYPNKNFWVTEVSQYDDAWAELGENPAAILVWDGFDSVYNHPKLHGGHLDPPNDAGDGPALLSYNASTGVYTPRKEYYQYAQLFKYVTPGSQRVAATESAAGVTTYAFRDTVTNRTTIVGRNTGAAVVFNATMASMPAVSALEFYYTDWSGGANLQRGTDVAVANGSFTFTAPASSVFTLTFAGTPDTTAPTAPSDVTATSPMPTQASLTWTASADNMGVTGYDVYRSITAGFTPNAANKVGTVTNTTFADNGLAAGTYYYQVQACDAFSNLSPFSAEASVTVEADTVPPSAPANLAATSVSASSVSLAWTAATDNVAVVRYNVLRNGVAIGTSSSATYTDNTATASTTATYSVTAQDAVGNVSAASNEVIVTTPAAPLPVTLDTLVNFHQTSAATSMSISGVTTTGTDELLVAFIASDGRSGSGTQSIANVTGGGLTWTMRGRTNTRSGTSEIWTASAANVVNNATITATRSGSYVGSITVASFKNADLTIGAIASANASTGAASVSLTATRNGSWVWAVGNDWDGATARTVGANQTKVDEYLAPSFSSTFWVQRRTTADSVAGSSVTLSTTAPTNHRWNLTAIEILPRL